jgi:hypothetical protein
LGAQKTKVVLLIVLAVVIGMKFCDSYTLRTLDEVDVRYLDKNSYASHHHQF